MLIRILIFTTIVFASFSLANKAKFTSGISSTISNEINLDKVDFETLKNDVNIDFVSLLKGLEYESKISKEHEAKVIELFKKYPFEEIFKNINSTNNFEHLEAYIVEKQILMQNQK